MTSGLLEFKSGAGRMGGKARGWGDTGGGGERSRGRPENVLEVGVSKS